MTRMTGPECAVMCNLKIHAHTLTNNEEKGWGVTEKLSVEGLLHLSHLSRLVRGLMTTIGLVGNLHTW